MAQTPEDALEWAPPMRALFTFPDPVNEIAARLVAGGVVVMAALVIVFDVRWIVALLMYGFIARVLAGPRFSPLGLLVTRVVVPRLDLEPRLVPGPPKRFAQAIGVVFTTGAAAAALAGRWDVAEVVLGLLLVAAALEAFLGLCLGCKIFAGLMRLGVIPASTCERCNELWGRPATPQT